MFPGSDIVDLNLPMVCEPPRPEETPLMASPSPLMLAGRAILGFAATALMAPATALIGAIVWPVGFAVLFFWSLFIVLQGSEIPGFFGWFVAYIMVLPFNLAHKLLWPSRDDDPYTDDCTGGRYLDVQGQPSCIEVMKHREKRNLPCGNNTFVEATCSSYQDNQFNWTKVISLNATC